MPRRTLEFVAKLAAQERRRPGHAHIVEVELHPARRCKRKPKGAPIGFALYTHEQAPPCAPTRRSPYRYMRPHALCTPGNPALLRTLLVPTGVAQLRAGGRCVLRARCIATGMRNIEAERDERMPDMPAFQHAVVRAPSAPSPVWTSRNAPMPCSCAHKPHGGQGGVRALVPESCEPRRARPNRVAFGNLASRDPAPPRGSGGTYGGRHARPRVAEAASACARKCSAASRSCHVGRLQTALHLFCKASITCHHGSMAGLPSSVCSPVPSSARKVPELIRCREPFRSLVGQV